MSAIKLQLSMWIEGNPLRSRSWRKLLLVFLLSKASNKLDPRLPAASRVKNLVFLRRLVQVLIVTLATSTGAYNATTAIIDAPSRGASVHVVEVEKFFIHILHMMLLRQEALPSAAAKSTRCLCSIYHNNYHTTFAPTLRTKCFNFILRWTSPK